MRRRLATTTAVLIGATAALWVGLGPAGTAGAATCTRPRIERVDPQPSTLAIGISNDAVVEVVMKVTANGCALSKPKGGISSPTGGRANFAMERLDAANGIYTYAVRIGIAPSELYNDDLGLWDTFGSVQYAGGTVSAQGEVLRVKRAAKVLINATPEPVKKGRSITLEGTIRYANWEARKYIGYGSRRVYLQFKPAGGAYKTVQTLTSAKGGVLRTTVKATADGCFRFVYNGGLTTGGKASPGDCVDVR